MLRGTLDLWHANRRPFFQGYSTLFAFFFSSSSSSSSIKTGKMMFVLLICRPGLTERPKATLPSGGRAVLQQLWIREAAD